MGETKFTLPESAIPERWYNIQADMPNRPQPVLHPGTGQPIGPDDLAPLFPMELILQEVSEDAEITIPEPLRDVYRLWRPTPLYRARRLEQAIGTRSRIARPDCVSSEGLATISAPQAWIRERRNGFCSYEILTM